MTSQKQNHSPQQPSDDAWTPMKLVFLGVVTLTVSFTIINFLANTGLR